MSATTDFEGWLDDIGSLGPVQVYELAQAVRSGGEHGDFEGKGSGEETVITAGQGYEALIIPSPEAEKTFLEMVRERYCDGMTIEGYYYKYQAD